MPEKSIIKNSETASFLADKEIFSARIARILTLFLTFLLPVKFVTFMSTPESVPLYRFDIISLLVITWPATLFEIASGFNLGLAALLFLRGKGQNIKKSLCIYGGLWLFLVLASLPGLVHASAPVYADQMLPHIFSMAAYALSLCVLCNHDEKSLQTVKTAFFFGAVFAVYAGLRQHYIGFQELRKYITEQAAEMGQNVINEQIAVRLEEARVQGDFASCNTYGAFLAALLPFAIAAVWKFGNERVSPPVFSRRLFVGFAAGFIGYTLYLTGSRGAILALMIGVGLLVVSLPMARKWHIILIGTATLAVLLLLTFIVSTGRGGGSLAVRLDYWQAAARMFLQHPLCGTGWGDFFHDYGQLRFWLDKESPHTPHNMILLFASQCGIAGLTAVCAVLLYPVLHAVRSINHTEFQWHNAAMWCGFTAPLTLFILVIGAQFDLGFETPAYTAMLIVFSIAVLSGGNDRIKCSRRCRKWACVIMLIFAVVTVAISIRQFRGEYTATILNEELDPRFSQTHTLNYVSNMERVSELLKNAVAADAHSPFLWASAAKYAFRLGEKYVALQWMDEAIRRSPERSSFYLDRARMRYFMNGGIVDAACHDDLSQLRKLSPKNPDFTVPDEQLLNPTINQ